MGKQHPKYGSLWVHYDRSAFDGIPGDQIVAAIFAGRPIACTFICVTGTSWSGNVDDPGSVGVDYFSQNHVHGGQTSHLTEIPEEIRHLTIDGFWQIVADRKLRLLTEEIDTVATLEPIFQPGDTVVIQP